MKLKVVVMTLISFFLFLILSIISYADEIVESGEVAKGSINWYLVILIFALISIVAALIIRFSHKPTKVGKEITEEIP